MSKLQPVIERGVPLLGHRRSYPFRAMKVGDSFFVAGAKIQTLSGAACNVASRSGFRFTCRTVDGGVRVWRIA